MTNTIHLYDIIERMTKAHRHVKFPSITLQMFNGCQLQLIWAGEKSKFPGSINLTDGGSFGSNQWYGRIHANGQLAIASRWADSDPTLVNVIETTLVAFDEAPQTMAKSHGNQTGHCCFCNRAISHPASLANGYGPDCASRYGLPWETPRITDEELNDKVRQMVATALNEIAEGDR